MVLSGYQTSPAAPAPQPRGMATVSLVLGLAGLPGLLLCGLGVPLGVAGVAVGVIAVVRGGRRRAAVAGIVASLTTLALGAAMAAWLLTHAATCADSVKYPDDSATARCLEREFPFAEGIARPEPPAP